MESPVSWSIQKWINLLKIQGVDGSGVLKIQETVNVSIEEFNQLNFEPVEPHTRTEQHTFPRDCGKALSITHIRME